MFEYKIELFDRNKTYKELESFLNELGKEGWELVTEPFTSHGYTKLLLESSNSDGYVLIFKRSKNE